MTLETFWGVGRAVLVGLLLAVLLLRLFEDRLIFFPDLFSEDVDPARAGVPVEDVFFTTSDGLKLHGWHSAAEGGAPASRTSGRVPGLVPPRPRAAHP